MRITLYFYCLLGICCLMAAGCSGPTFRNIGVGRDNIGVSVKSIEDYAERHGMTTEQAVAAMRLEIQQNRIAEHAAKYGITEEEAAAQLEFAASHRE